jgi:hypothetical protein
MLVFPAEAAGAVTLGWLKSIRKANGTRPFASEKYGPFPWLSMT